MEPDLAEQRHHQVWIGMDAAVCQQCDWTGMNPHAPDDAFAATSFTTTAASGSDAEDSSREESDDRVTAKHGGRVV